LDLGTLVHTQKKSVYSNKKSELFTLLPLLFTFFLKSDRIVIGIFIRKQNKQIKKERVIYLRYSKETCCFSTTTFKLAFSTLAAFNSRLS
jgi:hypothetical protein